MERTLSSFRKSILLVEANLEDVKLIAFNHFPIEYLRSRLFPFQGATSLASLDAAFHQVKIELAYCSQRDYDSC